MAKPDKPLLSLGARGTIAHSLTFQKRGRTPFVRQKPVPKDPKSPAQLAQRQIYKDAVDAWHALSPEEREAWRGVCPGLTPYQCFMRSALEYAPPPVPIDIGEEAKDRAFWSEPGYTRINKGNPANATGILTSVELWAVSQMEGCRVGTFYIISPDRLKCRDSVLIGNVPSGSKQVFPGLSIAVEAGDYIGSYWTSGQLERDGEGYGGTWHIILEYIDPGDESNYIFWAGHAYSLYGTGETQP